MHAALLLILILPAMHAVAGNSDVIADPTLDRFSVCFDHSCKTVVTTSISATEWAAVTAPLHEPANGSDAERQAIARYIAGMETLIGARTATSADLGGNLKGMFRTGQMDCIDESSNTSTYLRLLEQHGLLHYHRVLDTATRFGLFIGMPHTTAVIQDPDGTRYAVDSWFFDNGVEPAILPLQEWKAGWRPQQDTRP